MMASLLIVADASSSAEPVWKNTIQTINKLIDLLPSNSVHGVGILGSSLYWQLENWTGFNTIPHMARNTGSFIAPTIQSLYENEGQTTGLIIVGNGKVYDLEDWLEYVPSLYLVVTGDESLQGNSGTLLEVSDNETELRQMVQSVSRLDSLTAVRTPPTLTGFIRHDWTIDPAGFPMIHIKELDAFVHLFPFVKPQLEMALSLMRHPSFDDRWYTELLKISPRPNLSSRAFDPYEHLLVSGVIPGEIEDLLDWYGPGYHLPSIDEWRIAYRWLSDQEDSVPPGDITSSLSISARTIWKSLHSQIKPKSICDLALMRGGLLEWVASPQQRYVGLGLPRPEYYPTFHDPIRGKPFIPTSLQRRSKFFGFRLLRRV